MKKSLAKGDFRKAEGKENGKLKKKSTIMIDNPVTTYKGVIKTKSRKNYQRKIKRSKKHNVRTI